MMGDRTLRVDLNGGVATVTLDRPHVGNSLSSELIVELRAALARLDADPKVGAIVLTGTGSVFCAGLDLDELGKDGANLALGDLGPGAPPSSPWLPLRTPLVGAINGAAVTGGLELALHCDVLLASTSASFADTHARVGVLPGWGMTVLLPLAVGRGLARRMSLTGEFLNADEALRAGLVTEVVPSEELLTAAHAVASAIAEADPTTVQAVLAGYRDVESALVGDGPARETRAANDWVEDFDHTAVADRLDAVLARNRPHREPR